MKFEEFVTNFKKDIDYRKTGMILFHNGVMRATSRDGKAVTKLSVKKDDKKIKSILKEFSEQNGISKINAAVFEGEFSPGDNIMYVGVAGDIRDNVFPALENLVNKIKKEAVFKEETPMPTNCRKQL